MTRRLKYFDQSGASLWLDPIDLFIAVEISESLGSTSGPPEVLEVGLYRGAWIFSLAKNVPKIPRLVGIDPYPDDQLGLRHLLPKRATELGLADRFTHYDSWEELSSGEITTGVKRRFDLIHIDGDHSFDGAALDLMHVDDWLNPGGIVIVDDFYNPHYPGIAAATYQFLDEGDFVMFLLTRNKAYLTRIEDQETWMSRLRKCLDDSPLGYATCDWRGRNEAQSSADLSGSGAVEMLLCLDDARRSELLPSARDRKARKVARDWLPPKVATWLQARRSRF